MSIKLIPKKDLKVDGNRVLQRIPTIYYEKEDIQFYNWECIAIFSSNNDNNALAQLFIDVIGYEED